MDKERRNFLKGKMGGYEDFMKRSDKKEFKAKKEEKDVTSNPEKKED